MEADHDSGPVSWVLTPGDHALVMAKRGTTRFGFAVLLMFFRERGRFPRSDTEVDLVQAEDLARQLNISAPAHSALWLPERTAERCRAEIRSCLGFREATVADAETLTEWLRDHVAAEAAGESAQMVGRLEARCRELLIEPPAPDRIDRMVRTAFRTHEERFCALIRGRLSEPTSARLDALLRPTGAPDSAAASDTPGVLPAALISFVPIPDARALPA